MKIKKKTIKLWILAQSVDSGSQGKNRFSAITQSTLGWGLIKNPIFWEIGIKAKNWEYLNF
jgi:hypothetical protein